MSSHSHPFRSVAIIQARMAASRLPNKVMLDLAGQPDLARVVQRARRSQGLDEVVVATTTDASDDPVADFCAQRGYACFRGNALDVLDRYYQAARQYKADVVVRLTADCPLIDPALIDQVLAAFFGPAGADLPFDFAANRLPPPFHRTFPIGLDVEVCSFAGLERAWREADQKYQREHVMPYFYEPARSVHYHSYEESLRNPAPAGFNRVRLIDHDPDYGALRWTLDTPQDLEVIRRVFEHFGGRDDFSWLEVLDLFQRHPELAELNAGVQHKTYLDTDQRNVDKPRS